MSKKLLLVIVFIFSVNFTAFTQNGKLDKGKQSLKTKSTSSSGSSSRTKKASRRSNNNRSSSMSPFFVEFFFKLIVGIPYGVLVGTNAEDEGRMYTADISKYPYLNSNHGNFIYEDSTATKSKTVRLDVYNNFIVESKNLYGNNLGIDLRFLKRFSLEANYLNFVEKVRGRKDSFTLYAAMLKYYRIRTQRFEAWYGLGATRVANDVNETGFTIGAGAELFFKKPLSLAVSYKSAFINTTKINNTKVLFKYHIKNLRVSSGYEHYKLGVSEINAFSLGIGASF